MQARGLRLLNRQSIVATLYCKNSSKKISFIPLNRIVITSQHGILAVKAFPVQIRSFSDKKDDNSMSSASDISPSEIVSSASDPFAANSDGILNAAASAIAEGSNAIPSEAIVAATEHSNIVIRNIMGAIEHLHLFADIPYWQAIVLTTIGLRFLLLPVVIKTVQSSAKLQAIRPIIMKIQERMNNDPNGQDHQTKLRYQTEMQQMFLKHKVNPFRSMLWPITQLPVFIAFFMALRQMGEYYPGFVTGGAYWFVNLATPDIYYILPVINAASFLLMIELGADGANVQQQAQFKWVMRAVGVTMIPLTADMPQGLFVYWTANNFFSIIQTLIMKQPAVKTFLQIPEIPKEVNDPGLKVMNPIKKIQEMWENESAKSANAKAEILDGVVSKATTTTAAAAVGAKKATGSAAGPPGAPPKTYSAPPKATKKNGSTTTNNNGSEGDSEKK